MYQYDYLSISHHCCVAHIALNRPDKANALNRALWSEIKHCFSSLKTNNEIHAIVISGEGKHFCAGIDLHFLRDAQQAFCEFPKGLREEKLKEFILELQSSFDAIENCEKPVIAAIHGKCIGAGVDLVSACDLRYSTLEASFSIKEVDLGIVADTGSLQRLPYLMSHGIVAELAFTGRTFSAEEARRFGMLNDCFPDEKTLREQALNVAKAIANKDAETLKGIKKALLYSRDHKIAESLTQVAEWNAKVL